MAEVPKIVRVRLRGQAAAGEHLDPNLLSAFAEGVLTEHERVDAMEHLSRCAECRDVLAVMSPDPEQVQPAALVRTAESRSWWRSPVVHWGALVAAAAVVLIAVLVGPHRERKPLSASAPATQPAASETVEPKVPASESAAVSAKKAEPAKIGKKSAIAKAAPRPQVESGIVGSAGGGAAGMVGGEVRRAQPAAQPQIAAVPAPPAATRRADTEIFSAGEAKAQDKLATPQAKAAPAPSAQSESVEVNAAAAPILQKQPAVLNGRNKAFALKRESLTSRWTVAGSGALQRSFDGGRTWKEVAVARGVKFRAVAVVGIDVWAGGSGGMLFHSADAGEQWSRVRVESKGEVLSGDIIGVDFTDADHGVIGTSTAETWMTSNGGASWQRQ